MPKESSLNILSFALGFAVSSVLFFFSFVIHTNLSNFTPSTSQPDIKTVVNLDPFPLPPCAPNQTLAVYVQYHYLSTSLFTSIDSLWISQFPGRIRIIVDTLVNETIRQELDKKFNDKKRHWSDKIDVFVVPSLPNLKGKELIPHSNKIRALQAGTFAPSSRDNDDGYYECSVYFDADTYVNHFEGVPWSELLSTLQLNDFAVSNDCRVPIDSVPEYLSLWMPNTGVLALRNTPRTKLVLKDWLDWYVPCNATHVSTCMSGTDQYPFLKLLVHHAARFDKLGHEWNCRIGQEAGMQEFPMYTTTIVSPKPKPWMEQEDGNNKSIITAPLRTKCGGTKICHVLHGHFLEYWKS